MQQRPVRVQSVLRGPTQASCLQAAVTDGQRAADNGYVPVWQSWGQEGGLVTLTIYYDLAPAPAAPAWTQPTAPPPAPAAAPAWTQPTAPPPAPAAAPAWTQPPTSPPAQRPTQPGAIPGWPQPPASSPPSAPAAQQWAPTTPPVTQPPLSGLSPQALGTGLVRRAVIFVVLFIIAFVVYSALNRVLY